MLRGVDGTMLEEIQDAIGKLKDKLTLGFQTMLSHDGENHSAMKSDLVALRQDVERFAMLAAQSPSHDVYAQAIESINGSLVAMVDAINKLREDATQDNANGLDAEKRIVGRIADESHRIRLQGERIIMDVEKARTSIANTFSNTESMRGQSRSICDALDVLTEHVNTQRSHLALTRAYQMATLALIPVSNVILYFILRAD